MLSRSFLAAWGLAALVSLSAPAQSTTTPAQQPPPAGGLQPGAPPLQLQNLPPDDHTLTPEEQAQERQQRAYQAAIRLAGLEARWGSAMSTPGVSISLVETGRSKTPAGATQLTYQITGSGFRAGEQLSLIRWPLGESMKTVMDGLVLNAQGRLICAPASALPSPAAPSGNTAAAQPGAANTPAVPGCLASMQPSQPVEIQSTAAPGEAIRVAVIGTDHSNGAAAEAIPFPIVSHDQGCSLEAIIGLRNADLDLIRASGFPPNSTLKLDVTTGAESHTLDTKTNDQGLSVMAFLPGVHGQTSGDTTVRFAGMVHPPTLAGSAAPTTPDPTCAPSVTLHWGQGTYKPE